MIVRYIKNKLSDIDDPKIINYLKNYIRCGEDEVIGYTPIGKEFIVYGAVFREGYLWYYICEEEEDTYPVPKFSGFFEVTNSHKSKYLLETVDEYRNQNQLVFKEWANDDRFYEKLLDGYPEEVNTFKYYKEKINEEHLLD